MKLTQILTLTTALLVLASPLALAAKAKPEGKVDPAKKAARQAHKAVAPLDTNKDGAITGDESTALRKAFDADKTGPLKTLDLNSDGTLGDDEIAKIKVGRHGKANNSAKAGRGAKKKNAV